MRRTYELFCDQIVRGLREAGELTDDVMAKAALASFMNLERKTPEAERAAALRKARRLLRRPDVRERLGDLYESRGFSILDAIDMHVWHIRGTAPGQDGEASYQALKDFEKMVLPQQPTRIDQRVLVGHTRSFAAEKLEHAPAMEARVLSASVESPAE